MTGRTNVPRVIFTVIMFAVAVTMISPLVWMVSASLKFEKDVFNFPIEWIPKNFHAAENYRTVWAENQFALYYWNTIKVAVLTTLSQVTISALGAYAFSKINFRGRDKIFFFYLTTLMIPMQVTIIPTFMIFSWFRLINTHLGLIVVASFSVYGAFLLRQYMITIPEEVSESARIDGAGHLTIFSRIIIPMSIPAVATLMILKFIWTWNDYQNPLIFLSSRRLYTLQLAIQSFQTEYSQFFALMMAAAVSSILPLVVAFLFAQRYVIEGISLGAVKG